MFNTVKFRDAKPVTEEIVYDKKNTLIIIRAELLSTFYKDATEKLEALQWSQPDDLILFVWTGKWSTDIFQFKQEDTERILTA
jgi:hypothetical protein